MVKARSDSSGSSGSSEGRGEAAQVAPVVGGAVPTGREARRVAGVVLAAGRSRRMGRPKPLLRVDGSTFVERTVGALRGGGCGEVLVVLRVDDREGSRLAERLGATVVPNADAESEQVDSLRLAVRAAGEAPAVCVLPVDHPLVRPETVALLLRRFGAGDVPIVRPRHHGVPGHPTVFGRAVFPELLRTDLPDGARTLLYAHVGETADLVVDDPGVVANIDTPEDYQRFTGTVPPDAAPADPPESEPR